MRIVWARALAALAVAVGFAYGEWSLASPRERVLGVLALAGWAVAEVLIRGVLGRRVPVQRAWLHAAQDLAAIAVFVAATGAGESPWQALFGLAILSAAVEGSWQAPFVVAWFASAAWLVMGWLTHSWPGLHEVLLQVSGWLLAGATLSSIARRWRHMQRAEAETRRVHRALQRLHAHVLEAMREGLALLDGEGRIIELNPAGQDLLAASPEEVQRRLGEAYPRLLEAAATGELVETEIEWEGRTLMLRAAPLHAPASGASAVLTISDATPVRDLERKLAEEKRLVELGRMSAMVAHEIRNPLQTIRQALAFLADGDDAEARAVMEEEVLRLERFVRSMLDFARPLAPKPRRITAQDWLVPALRALHARARRNVRVKLRDAPIVADPDHLRIVLDNLLDNALKRGDVPVHLGWRVQDGAFRLEVEDEGGGVSEEVRERIWDAFVSGTVGGVGLGLATVRRICEANGWHVRLEDGAKGARFVVEGDAHGTRAAR